MITVIIWHYSLSVYILYEKDKNVHPVPSGDSTSKHPEPSNS
jgi:hypothetical protein